MTVQASDSVIFQQKKFTLIDVEKDKQIIDCARFKIPEHTQSKASGCRRGYTAKYTIEDNKLYGIRYEYDWSKQKQLASKKLFMDFTGSCIIAMAEDENKQWYISDFIEAYLDFDKALELHFTNGILDEIRDLGEAIAEMEKLRETELYKNDSTTPDTREKLRKEIALKYLKYEYGWRSYKWRGSGIDR